MIYPESFEHKIGFTHVREAVAEHATSALGRQRCEDMTFLTDHHLITTLLRQVAEMTVIASGDEAFPISGMHDITSSLKALKVPGNLIPADELLRVRRTLVVMADISSFFSRHRDENGHSVYQALDEVAFRLSPFSEAVRLIDRVLDQYGNVRDTASPELGDIRRRMASMTGAVQAAIRRVMTRGVTQGVIDSDASPAMRDGRLVVPVAPMYKRKVAGIVHDESASGKTVYIEPAEVVEANNRIRELQMEERREIMRILAEVAATLRPHADEMLESLDVLGEIDFIYAKAGYALDINATLPVVADGPELEWYHACHPVLLKKLEQQGREIVPLDITLSAERRMLIISGPNAGGKSVCLKTVGIVQYMTQCGLLPPVYENSRMGVFEDIFVDIGDDQSIENDLSTYSSHLRNMKTMTVNGRSTSLVLVDEFGAGTEPQIGGAIAQAILHRFNESGMWGVITTHYQNLKEYADHTPGLVNGSMLYDRQLMQPLFKLAIGSPGSSFALEIARKTGLAPEILDEAKEIVGSDYINMDRYLLDIARDRRYWENKRMSIRQKEKKVEEVLTRYQQDADTLRDKRREIIAEAREEARKILEGSNAVIERTIHDIRLSQAEKEKTLEARRKLEEEKTRMATETTGHHPLLSKVPKSRKKNSAPAAPQPQKEITVGSVVKLDGEGQPGTVTDIQGKNATVIFGMLKTTVKLNRLKPTTAKPQTGAGKASFVSAQTSDSLRSRQLQFKQDIDVRGMRVDEAVQAVTYFIDDAIQFNVSRVRILHGTGTGALRQYIRNYLDTVPGVHSYSDEDVRFGGAGITVVNLD